MRKSSLVIIVGALLITGVVTPVHAQSFIMDCEPSHRAPDDPIVFPLQPGASHSHDFFGNTTTSAMSTYESMIDGQTNCEEPGDSAGYWVPTLLTGDGTPIAPRRITIYYRDRPKPDRRTTPFPADFRMIAGGVASAGVLSGWNCDGTALSPSVRIDCSGETSGHTYVRGSIIFPMCGELDAAGAIVNDSQDHRSHVAYGTARTGCPADHPVQLPAIKVNVRYGVSNCIVTKCILSSDIGAVPGSSFHADFWNTWNQTVLEQLVNSQLNS